MNSIASLTRTFADAESIEAPTTASFELLHLTADESVAFAMRHPLLDGKQPVYFMACTNYALAVSGEPQFSYNNQAYYMSSFYHGSTMAEVVEDLGESKRDMAGFNITPADLAAALAAA